MIHFSCEKKLLMEAINSTSRVVSSKSTIPALSGLLLHADHVLTISGYNMQTGIRTDVSANIISPGDIVLDAKVFGEMINQMPDDMVVLEADENLTVHLNCGDVQYNLSGISAADYPDLPEVEDTFSVMLPQRTLGEMIDETSFAVSTNESRPVHTGALFEVANMELTMVAVDGFRLAMRREPITKLEGGNFSFVAPGNALTEVKNNCKDPEELAEITLGKRHVLFTLGGTELICRRLEGEFLDYRNAIPRKNPIVLRVDTRTMINSVGVVSVVIKEKMKSPVRCIFGQDRVQMSARTAIGSSQDICPVSGDGGGLEIGFNNRFLMDALRHAPADEVRMELNTGVSPAVIVPVEGEERFLYMVLPVRLKSGE